MVLDMIAKTGGSLLVGRVLDDAEDAVRDILDHAFDRLDSSLLKAAEQLVWMLGETRRELEGLTDLRLTSWTISKGASSRTSKASPSGLRKASAARLRSSMSWSRKR